MTTRSKWRQRKFPPTQLGTFFSPLLRQLLAQRGLVDPTSVHAFLDPHKYPPTPPHALPDFQRALGYISKTVERRERVLIWGDYDVDGLAAAAILEDALLSLGCEVYVQIPRYHGIRPTDLRNACEMFSPALVAVCDTGLSAHASFDYANSIGVTTVVFDHHHLPKRLPAANALVTPQRLPPDHPLYTLPTCALVFLLVEQLPIGQAARQYLDWVALGIVADAVELIGDARYLVQLGLAQLKQTQRLGLAALAAVVGVELAHVTADDIALRLAPALNAFGRLGDPADAYSLMTTRSSSTAAILAHQANTLNQQRRFLTRQIITAVTEQVKNDPSLLTWSALVLENPHWEGGVIGAAAAELSEQFARPVVLFAADDKGIARGSARSAVGYDLTAALAQIEDLLISYGGHAGAAGLSLDKDNLPIFRRRFSTALEAQQVEQSSDELLYDAPLAFDQITLELAQDIERLAPFGKGNPRPIFVVQNIQRRRTARIGRGEQHRRLTLRDEQGAEQSVLWWNSSHLPLPEGTFDLAYQIAPVYRSGAYELQITFVDWLQTQPPAPEAEQPELVDCRTEFDLAVIRAQEPSLMIWAEGYSVSQSPGLPLSQLDPAEALVILTAPASPDLLEKAIRKVQPKRIYFHGENPPFDTPQKLCEAISALLHTSQEQFGGEVKLTQLAERTAHAPATIRLALEALGESISIRWLTKSTLHVERAAPPPRIKFLPLERAMDETAAYRRFLARAEIDNLLP